MEHKILRSGTYTPRDDEDMSVLKTQHFSDGSAILVSDQGITLVCRRNEYRRTLRGREDDVASKGESDA